MEELSALPPDVPRTAPKRIRTTSSNVPQPFPRILSPSIPRTQSPLRHRVLLSQSSGEIVAPTPQRHLLDSSASQLWLRNTLLSPSSSRATSPVSESTQSRIHGHYNSFSARLSPGSSLGLSSTYPKGQRLHTDAGMGRRWIHWLHKKGLKPLIIPGVVGASVLAKLCIGLGSYSGRGTPPMYGDFEAQRHWMELTIHLPMRQWYTYDLQYWGLDYPPLTAYVSWLCGTIGSWIEPTWFTLEKSRGIETEGSKLFMRSTVVALDVIVYLPAIIMFVWTWHGGRSRRTQSIALITLLFQPALLLIDNGHFQYNCVMLGFTLLALNSFSTGRDLWGAVCFVLSLGFKQMSLYYAPAIGSYLLAKCIYLGPTQGVTLFIRLAVVTTLSFLLLFLPFLPPFAPPSIILDSITRIFPFARGLFEDKVANFWCASNVFLRWKEWGSPSFLIKLSTGLTALGFFPGTFNLLHIGYKHYVASKPIAAEIRPTISESKPAPFLPLLPYALLTSSMSFFLFSFQVHEKTILLPLLPITLLLSGAPINSSVFCWGVLVNNTAVFSMWPLLKRDGLGLQYVVTLVLWNRLIGYNPFRLPFYHSIISIAIYSAFLFVHFFEFFISAPTRYPDIYAVINILICTPVFGVTWLWSIKSGIESGWALGGLRPGPAKSEFGEKRQSGSSADVIVGSYRRMVDRLGYKRVD